MNFLKTSFWASITTGLNIITGFIATKIVALKLGPEGMAITGQFSNFTVLIALFATAACGNGVIKYTAAAKLPEQREKILYNSFGLVLIATIVLTLFTLIFSKYLSLTSFQSTEYADVFIIYGCVLLFTSINTITLAVLNGLGRIREMAFLSVTISVFNVICVCVSSYFFGIKAVLLASAFANVLAFLFCFSRLKEINVQFRFRKDYLDKRMILKLLRFSLMAMVSGILAPLLQIFVRSRIMIDYSLDSAGIWQATMKLSDYYLNFIFTVLSIYYLPKLSSIEDHDLIRKEIYIGYVRILPTVILLALLVWIFRDLIIDVAFTSEFADMVYLLKWQLVGDIIKVSSFILSYLLIAKGHLKAYITIELVFALLFILLSVLFINYYGIIGSVYAFVLNYFIYLGTLVFVLRRYLFL